MIAMITAVNGSKAVGRRRGVRVLPHEVDGSTCLDAAAKQAYYVTSLARAKVCT